METVLDGQDGFCVGSFNVHEGVGGEGEAKNLVLVQDVLRCLKAQRLPRVLCVRVV